MEPNDKARDRVLAILSVLALVLDLAALLVLGATGVFAVPAFIKVFRDMGHSLPGLTQFIVTVPAVIFLLAPILLGVALGVKEFLVRPVARLVINFIALPIILLPEGVIILALVLPLLSVTQAIR